MPHLLHPYKLALGGDITPTVQGNFTLASGDYTPLSTLSSMPTGGSVSRSGNAMLYVNDGGVAKLTYAPNNLYINSGSATNTARTITTKAGVNYYIWIQTSTGTATIEASGTNTTTFNGSVSGTFTAFTATAGTLTLTPTTSYANISQVVVAEITYETALRSGDNYVTGAAAYYGPRFDTDPSTLAAKGLLIEGTRTNLLNFSQSFATSGGSQNNWADTNITRNSTNNTSPDGTGNALRVTASAANGTIISSAAIGTSAQRVLSVWLRRVTGTGNIQYTLNNGSDWTTQAITSTWTRYSFTATTADQQVGFRIVTSADAIEIWGVQLEAGAFSTSYIPTTTATVARAAETFSITGYSTNLIEAFYTDEATGNAYSANYNAGVNPSTSFGWTTSLRVYTNAYAGDIATPSWIDNSGTTGNRMATDSTGALTWAPANMLRRSQDFSATWTLTNATQTAGQTDPNGGTSATTLTASAANGTVKQAVTTLAVTYIYSVWLKRKTGTGNIDITADGTTWVTQTITSSWARYSVVQTGVAGTSNPGIRIVTNGDAVDAYGCQLEAVTYQTQPRVYLPTTTAAVYQPRYDYDASTVPATPRGMLIEESRTNLLTYSQTFATDWTDTNITRVSTTRTSPDGTGNALEVSASAANGTIVRNAAIGSSAARTLSVYLRRVSGAGDIQYTTDNGSDWTTQAITSTWTRYSFAATTADQRVGFRIVTSGDTIQIWQAQLEAGSFSTSPIPTASASVTRVADVVKWTSAAVSIYWNQTQGTVATQVNRLVPAGRFVSAYSSSNARLLDNFFSGATSVANYSNCTGGGQFDFATSTVPSTGQVRAVFGYAVNNFGGSVNSQSVVKDTSIAVDVTVANVALGGYTAGANALNGHIQSFAYYNQRLPDAILKQKSQVNAPY